MSYTEHWRAVAVFLACESRGLIIGESAEMDVVHGIRQILLEDPAVERVGRVMTIHRRPREILVNVDLQFQAEA